METFLLYNLKAGLCLAAFYLFYKVLLSRETFHRLNRIVLLGTVFLSFVLPLCVITVFRDVPVLVYEISETPGSSPAEFPVAEYPDTPAHFFRWGIAVPLFWTGGILVLSYLLWAICRIAGIVRTGCRRRLGRRTELVLHRRELSPFSWFRYIVLSEKDFDENGPEIITHEEAHIRLKHSWDLILTDLACCLQWFNPAVWLLRSELRAIHEYEADEAVLASGVDARRYQMLLIKKAVGRRWCSVANSLNHSKLKKRITMMLQKKSSRWAAAKALYVLPLVSIALGAFAQTVEIPLDSKSNEKGADEQTVSSVRMISGNGTDDSETKALSEIIRSTDASGKEPLILIDGEKADRLDRITANEVASIRVLKDRSAEEAYGEAGANGVILVTTRSNEEIRRIQEAVEPALEEARRAMKEAEPALEEARRAMKEVEPALEEARRVMEAARPAIEEARKACDSAGRIQIEFSAAQTPSDGADAPALSGVFQSVGFFEPKGKDTPLLIVDGEKQDRMPQIDRNEIASIKVLKDRSAKEAYGEEGANGVILVTTKKRALQEERAALDKERAALAKEREEIEKTRKDIKKRRTEKKGIHYVGRSTTVHNPQKFGDWVKVNNSKSDFHVEVTGYERILVLCDGEVKDERFLRRLGKNEERITWIRPVTDSRLIASYGTRAQNCDLVLDMRTCKENRSKQ